MTKLEEWLFMGPSLASVSNDIKTPETDKRKYSDFACLPLRGAPECDIRAALYLKQL